MAKPVSPRLPPLSLRLTFGERAFLEQKAGGLSLSSYIKGELFSAAPSLGLGAPQRAVRPDQRALAQILAKLGETNLALSMSDLAEAASTGCLYVGDDVARQLQQACTDIAEIRLLLLEALGKRRQPALPKPNNLTEAFNLAASGSLKGRTHEVAP